MPNIAAVLKDEIVRLARKELRAELEGLRKANGQHRTEVAALKRRVTALECALAKSERKAAKLAGEAAPEPGTARKGRFSATRLLARREKLGLSRAEMGLLFGVSAQTIYNWEKGKRPKQAQIDALSEFGHLGKREVKARLAAATESAAEASGAAEA
jgi:hypothetical protein